MLQLSHAGMHTHKHTHMHECRVERHTPYRMSDRKMRVETPPTEWLIKKKKESRETDPPWNDWLKKIFFFRETHLPWNDRPRWWVACPPWPCSACRGAPDSVPSTCTCQHTAQDNAAEQIRSSWLHPFNVHLSTHSTRQCNRAKQTWVKNTRITPWSVNTILHSLIFSWNKIV